MARKGNRHETTDLDLARDELFSHVHRCSVLQATVEQQTEWMEETVHYLAERYPGLSTQELNELREIGIRFCQPVIPHGKGNTALSVHEEEGEASGASTSGVAAA